MKTKTEIKIKIQSLEKELKKIQKRFEVDDNYEDMEYLQSLSDEIDTLKWVLK